MSAKSNARRDAWLAGKNQRLTPTALIVAHDSALASVPGVSQGMSLMPSDPTIYANRAMRLDEDRIRFLMALDEEATKIPMYCGHARRDEHDNLVLDDKGIAYWDIDSVKHGRVYQKYYDMAMLGDLPLVDGTFVFPYHLLIGSMAAYVEAIESGAFLAVVMGARMWIGSKSAKVDRATLGGMGMRGDLSYRVWDSVRRMLDRIDSLRTAKAGKYDAAHADALNACQAMIDAWIVMHPNDLPFMPNALGILTSLSFQESSLKTALVEIANPAPSIDPAILAKREERRVARNEAARVKHAMLKASKLADVAQNPA